MKHAAIVGLVVIGFVGDVKAAERVGAAATLGSDVPSQAALLGQAPPEAKALVPLVREASQLFDAMEEQKRGIKRLRTEQDTARTRLSTVNEELTLQGQQRQRVLQQLQAVEADRLAHIEALRKELETKAGQEFIVASKQLDEELAQELQARLEQVETRQRADVDQSLAQEMELQEREFQQLGLEVQTQTEQLMRQLAQLQVRPEAINVVVKTASDALVKRKETLKERRATLQAERERGIAQQQAELVTRLKQQQEVERRTRLKIKEASLRQGMAELLKTANVEETGRLEALQHSLEEVTQRLAALSQEQASLRGRVDSFDKELAGYVQQIAQLQTKQQNAFVKLEQVFRQPAGQGRLEALAWLGQMAGQLSPELGGAVGELHERLLARDERERQFREQQRVFRERQVALQVSQEMESQRQRALAKQQQEQDARGRKVDELLVKAKQLASRGDFEQALRMVTQAHGLNPPQLTVVTEVRDQILAAQADINAKQQAEDVERLFTQAMAVFQQGRYEEAIPLFEQVIAREAELDRAVQVAGTVPVR